MVTALSRKELNQAIIEQLNPYYLWDNIPTEKSKSNQDNFPYALQEFINSHMDLPSFDEIFGKQNRPTLKVNLAR